MSVERQFQRRAALIPKLGLGLSVDVYSPDLWDLMNRFNADSTRPAYLEIFRAATSVLRAVRQSFGDVPLAYHGEGLWVTQPEFRMTPLFEHELDDVASELNALGSPWLNHECATKHMGGYSFGTYLPPLYTPESAYLVAENIALVQERLDRDCKRSNALGPLFLLEMPPLTYFMAGTLNVAEYFRLITERTPCGLVLDIGHLWTVYRYSAARKHSSVKAFVDRFLDAFPMERIIEIHIAGLAVHESDICGRERDQDPEWIDAHAADIPNVSWAILEQVVTHPRLRNLRAMALEVDTKPSERPSTWSRRPTIIELFGFPRTAAAGLSVISMTSGASMTSSRSRRSLRVRPSLNSPSSRSRSCSSTTAACPTSWMVCAGSSSARACNAPATVALGAKSPPMASNAIRAKARLPSLRSAARPRSTRTPDTHDADA